MSGLADARRVLFVTNLYPPQAVGGAEAVTARQAEELAACGVEVHVLTTDADDVGPRAQWQHALHNGVQVHRMRSFSPYHFTSRPSGHRGRLAFFALDLVNPVHAVRLRRFIKGLAPERVVFANLWNIGSSAWGAVPAGTRTVQVLHDGALVCLTGLMRHGTDECRGTLSPCKHAIHWRRRQSRRVDVVVAPSRWLLDACTQAGLFPRAAVQVLPNPVPPVPAQSLNASPRRGPRTQLEVLYLGQLEKHKGPDVLAAAVAGLEEVRCVLAGEGSLRAELTARYESAAMDFPGRVDGEAKERLFAQADVLVVPSVCNENAPSVLQEAFAHGLPVIASCTGGVPEMLSDGVEGYLVKPGDVDGLRRALEDLAAAVPAERARMVSAARRRHAVQAAASNPVWLLEV